MGKYWKRLRKKDRRRLAAQEAMAKNPQAFIPAAPTNDNEKSVRDAAKRAAREARRAERAASRKAGREAEREARRPGPAANTNAPGIVPAAAKGGLSRTFNVYADGSARGNGRHMGAGWIIFETTSGQPREFSRAGVKVTEPAQNGTSVFAELAAATGALNAVPAGSRVRLHLDCQVVVDTLHLGSIEKHIGAPKRHRDMRIAAARLFNAAARHEKVETIKIVDTADSPQRIAHHLAKGSSKAGYGRSAP
jgi:ribonuclease HI